MVPPGVALSFIPPALEHPNGTIAAQARAHSPSGRLGTGIAAQLKGLASGPGFLVSPLDAAGVSAGWACHGRGPRTPPSTPSTRSKKRVPH